MDPPAAAALAALIEEHADFVWRSLRRLGVPEAAADDATQQVFLVIQSKLDSIIRGRERSFLFGVVMNTAAHMRRSFARRREVDESHASGMIDPAPLPDAAIDDQRARAMLDAILEEMELDLRTVFVMSDLEEMPMIEISAVLGIPRGTVASRLRRARADFRERAQRLRARTEREARTGASVLLAFTGGPHHGGGAR